MHRLRGTRQRHRLSSAFIPLYQKEVQPHKLGSGHFATPPRFAASAATSNMLFLGVLIFLGTISAQQNESDGCLNTCFSAFCGSNFFQNLTCLCNETLYGQVQICLTSNCVQEDFAAAQALEYQYCGPFLSPKSFNM